MPSSPGDDLCTWGSAPLVVLAFGRRVDSDRKPMSAPEANAEQIRYWNEAAGPKWVVFQKVIDAQIAPLGERAMDRAGIAPGARGGPDERPLRERRRADTSAFPGRFRRRLLALRRHVLRRPRGGVREPARGASTGRTAGLRLLAAAAREPVALRAAARRRAAPHAAAAARPRRPR